MPCQHLPRNKGIFPLTKERPMRSLFEWNKQKSLCVMTPGLNEQIHVTGLSGSTVFQYATCLEITGRVGKIFLFDKVSDPVIVLAKKLHYQAGELCAETLYAARPYCQSHTLSLGVTSVMPRLTEYLVQSGEYGSIFVPEGEENFPLYLGECLIPARGKNHHYLLTETEIRNFGRYDERLVAGRQQVGELVYRWTLRPYAEMTVALTRAQ